MADTIDRETISTGGLLVPLSVALRGAVRTVRTAVKVQAYEGFGRDRWQRTTDVLQRLGIRPGDRIADLGAGGGYFTFRLAAATGPAGRIYAVDTDPDMLDHLRARVARERISNVEVVEASATDPHVPAGGIDLIFSCDAYHHFSDRVAYFAGVRRALRPGGRLGIIDHDGTTGLMPRWFGHATPPGVMCDELQAAGYRVSETYGDLPGQTFLMLSVS